MTETVDARRVGVVELRKVIEANPGIDWRAVPLSGPAWPGAAALGDLSPESVQPLLQAYQRLLRVLPESEDHRALPLLEDGLHSAIQIASLSRDEFLRRFTGLFPGEDEAGLAVHQAALRRRSELVLRYIREVQNNEPHYRAARFR